MQTLFVIFYSTSVPPQMTFKRPKAFFVEILFLNFLRNFAHDDLSNIKKTKYVYILIFEPKIFYLSKFY